MSVAARARGLIKHYDGVVAVDGVDVSVLGNALWLAVLTAAVIVVPIVAMRRRLVA